jgi:hypothetical protein
MSKKKINLNLVIQSARFDKKLYDIDKALKIIGELGLFPLKKPDIIKNQIRIRLIDSEFFKQKSFKIFQHPAIKGVSFVMGEIKKHNKLKPKKKVTDVKI